MHEKQILARATGILKENSGYPHIFGDNEPTIIENDVRSAYPT